MASLKQQQQQQQQQHIDLQPSLRRRGGDPEDCAAMLSDSADPRYADAAGALCALEQMLDFQV